MEYEVSFSFYVENDEPDRKDALVLELESTDISIDEFYDDGEDFCLECTATVILGKKAKNEEQIQKSFEKLLPETYAAYDYHYIKGIDNDFWWQP